MDRAIDTIFPKAYHSRVGRGAEPRPVSLVLNEVT
jgi:hypothetical protein